MALPDDHIDEFEMERWEWTDVHSLSSLWALRSASVRFIWTPVEELDAFVLTLLAPEGRIFWDFGEFHETFLAAQSRYTQALRTREDTLPHLDALCRDMGVERASFLAQVVFGGLTRPFGDRFVPRDLDADHFLLAQRHASIAMPAQCREAMSRYFKRQVTVFGDDAFRMCDERTVVVGGHETEAARAALGAAVEALNGGQRRDAIAWLTQALDRSSPLEAFGYAFACRGTVLSLFRPPGVAMDEMEALLRLRVRMVVEHASLPAVEAARAGLRTPGWDALAMADLREALLGALDAQLSRYPIIQTDPFAAWNPGPH